VPATDRPGTILVVDDEETFMLVVTTLLEQDGHRVVPAPDGDTALAAIEDHTPDLIVLDLELPGMSGLELLSRLRPRVDVPIVVVSGHEAESERVLAFDLGADDYVVKPFLSREFAARIRSWLRRSRTTRGAVYRFDSLEIRVDSREVTVAGRSVALSRREFDLLAYLAAHAGQVVPREQLLREVWQSSGEWQDTATVTEHVRRVRLKIEPDPSRPRWIQGVRNVGYRFEPDGGPNTP
jgi:two-component system, OmpR family, phosphate regulon response regulator PhoB